MENKLTVRKEQAWGNVRIVPVCQTSKLLARLAGTKTLTDQAVRIAKELGYTFQLEREEL